MSDKEIFIVLASSHFLRMSDAIFLLEGDGHSRIPMAVKLFRENYAPRIVICPGVNKPNSGSFPDILPQLLQQGIPESAIINVGSAKHTREEAVLMINYALEHKFKRAILVTSHYHQYRALLTFIKVMDERQFYINIMSAPATAMSWFDDNSWGVRIDLLKGEFEKIEQYRKSGDVATFKEGILYHKWKELNK
ncbi:MAG: YdcF family protein [Candidatus Vogelbacteria bacterium]|nr:YdcF family protein [Candidatus Vogelbacteria bacterium]